MPRLTNVSHHSSDMNRCPHCGVDCPNLIRSTEPWQTKSADGRNRRHWAAFECARCGGCVLADGGVNGDVINRFPSAIDQVHVEIPDKARNYLTQAMATTGVAPDGAVVLAASAVDAMLKDKGYKEGVLNSRIKKAAEDHVLTPEMEAWANDIRLDANDQRRWRQNFRIRLAVMLLEHGPQRLVTRHDRAQRRIERYSIDSPFERQRDRDDVARLRQAKTI